MKTKPNIIKHHNRLLLPFNHVLMNTKNRQPHRRQHRPSIGSMAPTAMQRASSSERTVCWASSIATSWTRTRRRTCFCRIFRNCGAIAVIRMWARFRYVSRGSSWAWSSRRRPAVKDGTWTVRIWRTRRTTACSSTSIGPDWMWVQWSNDCGSFSSAIPNWSKIVEIHNWADRSLSDALRTTTKNFESA